MTTQLVKADVTSYKLAQIGAQDLLRVVQENFGPGMLRFTDLERIKVPTGGVQSWETTDTLTGEITPIKAIEGIILAWQPARAYWPSRYSGASDPPACSSSDAITGVGTPGGDCLRCPFAKYGSAKDEKDQPAAGQACTETRIVLIARPGNLLPSVLSIPPTSLTNFRRYLVALSDRGISYREAITSFTLKATENTTGIKVSLITPRFVAALPPAVAARATELGTTLRGLLIQQPASDQSNDPDSWKNAPKLKTATSTTT